MRKDPQLFKEAFIFWFKLGFISFGGPAGQISIMHDFLVEKKKWISESKFLHALNYCMILPGPEAQQLATYIGWMLHGKKGGIIAGTLFVLPSMFILLAMSGIYVSYGNIPWIYEMFNGLKPAVIAIVVLALLKIGKKSLLSYFHFLMAFLSFVCIFLFNIPFPIIIGVAILLGLFAKKFFPFLLNQNQEKKEKEQKGESQYLINSLTTSNASTSFKELLKKIAIAIFLWFLPLGTLYYFSSDFVFWKDLSLFFTKAAFVTFGGAYAVLPYVAQVSVEKFHWLSNLQMIDGLALGESTPGPLIMVLVFVGFMAGYNHFESSLLFGGLGLLITTFYTFLPSFLFVLIGAPWIEKTQENNTFKQLLSLVTAAVVGVILNLLIYLGEAVIFPKGISFSGIDYFALLWTGISIFFLHRLKINMILWIGISAMFGLVRYFIESNFSL